jgi:hypothetical protein
MLSTSLNCMKSDNYEDDFVKALLVTLAYFALFSILILIPLIGFVIAFTLGAYIAGYRGTKYSVDWKKIAIIGSIIWSTILILITIFWIIPILPFRYDLEVGGWEIVVISFPFTLNIIFCLLGARARFKEKAVYL